MTTLINNARGIPDSYKSYFSLSFFINLFFIIFTG